MNTPSLKTIVAILRDYTSLVVPVVLIAVAVIILLATPLLMGSKLQEKVKSKSLTLARLAESLSDKAVPADQWIEAQKYQKAHSDDANRISQLARQTTQRELLSYKIFPEPRDKSLGIYQEFGRRYRASIDAMLEHLNATECPTEQEVQDILATSNPGTKTVASSMPFTSDIGGAGGNKVDRTIRDVVCTERARSGSMYAVASDLPGYRYWAPNEGGREGETFEYTGVEQSVEACWCWQLGYWIIEDVATTISALNAGSNSVLTSPVKRLLGVNFNSGRVSFGRTGTAARPEYVVLKQNEKPAALTLRTCNDDIDVVHFNVSVIVSNRDVLRFMRQLCSGKTHRFRGYFGNEEEQTFQHNQITILGSKTEAIQRESSEHTLYRYGDDAVVRLDLECEYVFKRSGYDEIKPAPVKEEPAGGGPNTMMQ
jgi:hypothetical protein